MCIAVGVVLLLATWAGSILIWYGATKMYSLNYGNVEQDGVSDAFNRFIDCRTISYPSTLDSDEGKAKQFQKINNEACRMKQAPTAYFSILIGVVIVLTTLPGFFALGEKRWAQYLFSIWSSVALAMLFVGIFVVLLTAGPVKKRIVNCQKLDADVVTALNQSGFICQDKQSSKDFVHAWRCFWAGLIISLVAYFLLSFLMSYIHAISKVLVAVPIEGRNTV